ncbi:chemotaxis protein CheA [Rhodovulum sp. MB263]|uniref:chemotaxis protein CheA n=1 Tax=Rhodovulum sp. (strain MB263) TaxID=308754 RepID=UPI0009B78AC0|nr:chemotaxis protein CheA [Rhodovulum sp. MB263]ARC87531.1 chemotaxis protein CheA [Rhodovulum sp. MB263]
MTLSSDPAETFRQEARDLLDTLEQTLLDLEQDPGDGALVDASFRALHTLKGSGAMFGYDEVAGFVHEFETAFDRVRKGRAAISPGLVRIALAARDHIADLIGAPGRHAAEGAPILAALRDIVDTRAGTAPAGAAEAAETGPETSPGTGPDGVRLRFRLPPDAIAFGTDPLLLLDELRELGASGIVALTDRLPGLEEIDPTGTYLDWEARFEAGISSEQIDDVFLFLREGMELTLEPLQPPEATEETSGDAAPLAEPAGAIRRGREAEGRAASSLRVPAERLDELMDRVGELVIAQSRLAQIAGAGGDLNLKAVVEELERLSSGLRDTTMGIRMVPIGTLFSRFRRLVHDLSGELGKEIDFVTSGEETELDKTMIERLADPLVHLIRNAIDHGVEAPGTRGHAGKPARGRVRLSAAHTGAEVAISIADDGAGLDPVRIRAKAEQNGLVTPEQKLTEQELFQLVFHPGFSTATEVTSISGRGVGMDVVKRTIEGLRGTIELTSTPGQGTVATLRLPLTLAIIESMLVQVGAGRYAIPLSAVEECVELSAAQEGRATGRNFLNIRGRLVPFLRLRELFGTRAERAEHQKVVIVSAGEARVGLVVDQIIGNSQTVIKSLSKLHADVETFSGATILGDGTVAMILDVGALVGFGQARESRLRGEQLGRVA